MTVPYSNSNKSKKAQIAEMFDNIAHSYDFLNHSLSLGIDKLWRNSLLKMIKHKKQSAILDIATGTGDMALAAMKLEPKSVLGIDISAGMIEVGKVKIEKKGLSHIIKLQKADSENIPLSDAQFDVITIAFGVRNFENLEKGLKEMLRVLKSGGVAAILEFSVPRYFPFKQFYGFYFKTLLPFWGRIISKDKAAYTYLPESIYAFPYGNRFLEILKNTGFINTKMKVLSFGIATIYYAEKK
ncbi:MAG: bifunctional demethylmenaquinone methyltransferase/2-methoxy-6-polyprenyl-1,4-benzoquinol methylase UbiE [Bacteroidales bacterium]|nr:bifunctional demethylmenaquinone methyltransferase/2-methoxy-6-polyprenyl-1,4-benzoquinol methylase UbiE [Bacteroidales bacterium]